MSRAHGVDARPVTDGSRVRWTLEQQYRDSQSSTRVDWLRFTIPLDAVTGGVDLAEVSAEFLDSLGTRGRDLVRESRAACMETGGAMWAAREGARKLCEVLGVFVPGLVEGRGMDYYEARCPLVQHGETVGFVLAGSRNSAQARTVHINLHGKATLHVSHAQWRAVADFIEASAGWITRLDLACDIFEGFDIEAVPGMWKRGDFDVRGKRPSQTEFGSWSSGHSRTFQVGKRETGKCCRVYEKGDEQFGFEAMDPWVRAEVEFRNSGRVIDVDALRRPSDYFAGAYPFCAELLDARDAEVVPARIATHRATLDKVASAAATRVVRWIKRTAAPAVAALLKFGGDALDSVFLEDDGRVPARLRGFSHAQLADAFDQVAQAFAPARAPLANGA